MKRSVLFTAMGLAGTLFLAGCGQASQRPAHLTGDEREPRSISQEAQDNANRAKFGASHLWAAPSHDER